MDILRYTQEKSSPFPLICNTSLPSKRSIVKTESNSSRWFLNVLRLLPFIRNETKNPEFVLALLTPSEYPIIHLPPFLLTDDYFLIIIRFNSRLFEMSKTLIERNAGRERERELKREKRGQIRGVNQFEIIPIRREKSDLSRQTCAASDPRIDERGSTTTRREQPDGAVGKAGEEGRTKEKREEHGGRGRVRGQCLVYPRVARGCQPQDNNFIIGGITLARRGTVSPWYVAWEGPPTLFPSGRAISSPALLSPPLLSLGTKPWVRYGRIIIESLYPLSKYHHGARAEL